MRISKSKTVRHKWLNIKIIIYDFVNLYETGGFMALIGVIGNLDEIRWRFNEEIERSFKFDFVVTHDGLANKPIAYVVENCV